MVYRRALLSAVGTAATAGCLRLSGESTQATSTTEEQQSQPKTTHTSESVSSNQESVSVTKIYADNLFENGKFTEENPPLTVRTKSERIELDGRWTGDTALLRNQVAANYVFEVLDGNSVVKATGTKTLIRNYGYLAQQTADSFFVTYHPSIGPNWDQTLEVAFNDTEFAITPEIHETKGVFEFDLSNSTVDPGRYTWELNITPVEDSHQFGPSIPIGTFDDSLLSVKSERSDFPTRSDVIDRVGAVSNTVSGTVPEPDTTPQNGMTIEASGVSGGSAGDDYPERTRETSVGFSVDCQDGVSLGGDSNHRFRIRNINSGTSLTFTPNP